MMTQPIYSRKPKTCLVTPILKYKSKRMRKRLKRMRKRKIQNMIR